MEKQLASMLAEAKGGPICFEGRSVIMGYEIPISKGQEVIVEFLKCSDDELVDQGFEVSIDKRKGYIEIYDQKFNHPVFWTKTAEKTLSFICHPKKDNGGLLIWNIWRNLEWGSKAAVHAWIGNAGLYVEDDGSGTVVLHCSHGINEVDFENLVISVTVK